MGTRALTKKIGRVFAVLAALALPVAAMADQLTASLDRNEIGLDESVSLRLMVTVNSNPGTSLSPRFVAPDFDELNEYSENFAKTYVGGGGIEVQYIHRLTKVLKPNRTGLLKVSNIHIEVNGKLMKAPDLAVNVTAAGGGTPPPRGQGGGGVGLRGALKNGRVKNVMIRAEIDKTRAYKGEQLTVSYYMYHRVPLFNLQADKFPVLNGFLREELEMPIQSNRLPSEVVVVDGVEYRRALLVRYAAYPLQEGKLKLDSLSVRYDYQTVNSVDEEDISSLLFGGRSLRKGSEHSEVLVVDVLPLPSGKPATFTGAVGDFTVTSAVDRYEIKANEALNLTVNVEGKGNAASIGEPKAKWPQSIEVYDSKGRSTPGKGGVGAKVFEYVLIPRTPGKLTLPAVEFAYFDPIQEKYVTKSTEPIELNVLEGAPGSAPPPKSPTTDATQAAQPSQPQQEAPRYLRPPESDPGVQGLPIWRYLYWICSALFIGLIAFVGWDTWRQFRGKVVPRKISKSKQWEKLRERASLLSRGGAWNEVIQTYDQLSSEIFDSLDQEYGLGARALSRKSLGQTLIEDRGLAIDEWSKINSLLEYAELVKYASSTGVISETAARQELPKWVEVGERVTRTLHFKPSKTQ